MKTSRHFKESEFQRCVPACSLQDMDQDFLNKLDALRDKCGIPLLLTSAYRSLEWERSKGRTGSGDHPSRRGVDISANNTATKFKIVKAAIELGFRRIGIANSFVHVGDTKTLAQDVLWLY